ncbi:MAG: DUF6064 family protein [Candidatus Helarchaeota archaeon]
MKSEIEELLNYIGQFNEGFFPFSLIIPTILIIIAFIFVYLCYTHPSKTVNISLKIFIVIIYIISGLETYSITFFTSINELYLSGAIIMWVIGALFLVDIFLNEIEFDFTKINLKDIKVVSLILIFWGTLIYPLVEILLGFTWPNMVFFGAECPSTIFVIGLLIGSIPNINIIIYIFLSISAIISGSMWGFQGAWFDIAYFASGIIGIIMVIRHWKKIKANREKLK